MASLKKNKTDGGAQHEKFKKMFRVWEDNKPDELAEQRVSRKYYHGKQWTDAETKELKRRNQPVITSNRIKRKVDFLVGMEIRQRRDPKAFPRKPDDEDSAELATDAVRFVCDNNHWPEKASSAAHDGLVGGIGAVLVDVHTVGRQVEVRIKEVPGDEFFYDPRSVRPDFSDGRFMGVHKWLDIDDAENFLGIEVDREELKAASAGLDDLVTSREEDKDPLWWDMEKDRLRVIEMYYKQGADWKLTQFTGAEIVRDIESPYKDENGGTANPYIPWSPYIDESGIHYGVVRDMRSPQDEINHRRSKLLHFMNSRQTIGEDGAVNDVNTMKLEMGKPDGHAKVNPNKRFEFVDNTFQANGQAELLQEAKSEIENLGPNPGLIGRGVEKQSGRAILAQQNSGMTELSPVFERLRMWKLRVYRAVWARVRQFWDGPRWVRIADVDNEVKFLAVNQIVMDQGIDPMTGEETEIPRLQNPVAEIDVDILLEEGPDTMTIQEEELELLTNLAGRGAPIPPEFIIELSNLRNKDKILERLRGDPEKQAAQQEQEQQLQQAATAIEFQGAQNDAELTAAKADNERAKAVKTGIEAQQAALELGTTVQ